MSDQDSTRPGQSNAARKRHRYSDTSAGPLSGQKRDKYTMTACNECRKRKIKCTGHVPCRRCESYELRCEYSQSPTQAGHQNNSTSKIASLEQDLVSLRAQVDLLSQGMNQTRHQSQTSSTSLEIGQASIQDNFRDAPNRGGSYTKPTQPRFIGPTSTDFNFQVANNTLKMMGIQNEIEDSSCVPSTTASRDPTPEPTSLVEASNNDPLCSIELDEIHRLLELYEQEIHPVYPFVPLQEIVQLVPSVYEHLKHQNENTARLGGNPTNQCCTIMTYDVQALKLVVSCALVTEGRGRSYSSQVLVNSVDSILSTNLRAVKIDVQELRVFTLTSIYYFHADEPVLAWRTIGFAARLALEIGLHRREILFQTLSDPQEREWAIKLFWCIYVLDRRWSFGIGMPFAIQDSDIDPELPHLKDSEPYLECLIAYGQICSKVWTAVAGYHNKSPDKETVAYLDFQIQRWQQSIPAQFQLLHPRLGEAASKQPRTLQLVRVLLYIRANQMRGYIHRHNVLSASNISEDLEGARRVTDIAKDTVRVLVHLRGTSTIYDTQQGVFNYFLVSALSAIFLAVCHAPAEFSHSCRNEFFSALGIVEELSAHSHISRRLWKTVGRLRSIAPKLGLAPSKAATVGRGNKDHETSQQHTMNHPYNTQLPASSGDLAGIIISESTVISDFQQSDNAALPPIFPTTSTFTAPSVSTSSGETPDMNQVGHELTNFFEAFDHFVDGQQQPNNLSHWMTEEEMYSLRNGAEISRLFEGFI
ncbi:hypothetical protein VTL71DRAFT_16525 [Oculimacula yallundae]|uniref:Zn(2)-C6 fungal-type domain-containing protein n=1 Tax=Oculimacula yallundae TaxID=86028 RepID=A0ABR4CFH8_9HELO